MKMVWTSRAWRKISSQTIANGFKIYKDYEASRPFQLRQNPSSHQDASLNQERSHNNPIQQIEPSGSSMLQDNQPIIQSSRPFNTTSCT